ncbi:hypothetical protein D9M69_602100 [compost metagenome]
MNPDEQETDEMRAARPVMAELLRVELFPVEYPFGEVTVVPPGRLSSEELQVIERHKTGLKKLVRNAEFDVLVLFARLGATYQFS